MYHHNTQKKEISQLFEGVFEIWKEEGETLADLLIRFRISMGYSQEEKITYAGRLDPMASGVVILLVGQARFAKEEWNAKKKTYELDILLGVQTDTLDMLGLVEKVAFIQKEQVAIETVIQTVSSLTTLPYPLYSSRTVHGKPLFVHARAGTVVSPPSKTVSLKDVLLLKIETKKLISCIDETLPIIQSVSGDFRQATVVSTWKEIQQKYKEMDFQIITVRVTASSGAYMRSLASWIGGELSVPALAYRIKRIAIQN